MVIQTAAAVAGSYHTDAKINQVNKVSATAVAQGVVVYLDVADDTFKINPTSGAGLAPFGVCTKAAVAADTKMEVALGGHVVVTADGAIAPGNYVQASTSTAGEVVEYAVTTVSGTPTQAEVQNARDQFRKIIGRYVGKATANERDGVALTAAADGDKIWIELGIASGGF